MVFGNALMITRNPLTTARDSQRRHQQQIRGGCTSQARQARIGNRLQLIRSKAAASTAVLISNKAPHTLAAPPPSS